jgi:(E)-4-hydroxy-3-methylbut-2-enyl-diphosphate synthase
MASERSVNVGGVQIGGGAPVVVQTMTKTETANLQATMDQIRRVAEAGADIVRCAVPREKDVEALRTIVKESPIPVIADIHFNHTLALKSIEAGAHCIRLNPGNIGGPDKVAEVAAAAKLAGTPMRLGVNSGSLPKHQHQHEFDNPVAALADTATVWLKWMSAMIGIGDSTTIVLSASMSLSRGTATRTRSAPASATLRIWSIVALRFAVSVFVIVWTTTGAPPPI